MKQANQIETMYTWSGNVAYTNRQLEDEAANVVMHRRALLPALIRNRSFITTFYDEIGDDGSLITVASSKGNEELLKEHKEIVGNDVVAEDVLYYFKVV